MPDPSRQIASFSPIGAVRLEGTMPFARSVTKLGAKLHRLDDTFRHLLGVAEQHHGIVAIEQRIGV